MLMAVKNNLKLIFSYLKLNLKKEAEYKTSFFLKIVMMILNDVFFILQWVVVFSIVDNIGGYGFNDVLLLWALSAGSYGVAHLFFNNAFSIAEIIYNGKLDVYLTQPKNLLINVSCSSCSVSAIGDILYAFIVLIIIKAAWWWYLAIIPAIIIGGLVFVSIAVIFQSLCFYIKNGSALSDMVASATTMFANYPPVIFKGVAKILLYTIIPAGFMVFIPAEAIFLGFNLWAILFWVAITILLIIIAFLSFKLGLKHYSSGNLMGGRL